MPAPTTNPSRTNPSRTHPSARMRRVVRRSLLAVSATVGTLLAAPAVGAATAPVLLATADSFSVLAGAGITNTGPTTIAGDAGTFATTSEVGFGTVTLHGVDHAGDAVTQQAKVDLTTAYNQAAGSGPPANVADELGGLTLTPGVYNGANLQITGTLTLDTLGDPNAVFIFQSGATLITASSSSVVVLGGGTACNVFWQVPSSATLGSNSQLIGTVMASTSITATTGATIAGRLLASTGAVTLDSNTITSPVCAPTPTTTTTAASPTTTAASASTSTPTGAGGTGGSGGTAGSPGSSGDGGSTTPTTTPDGSTTDTEAPPELAFGGASDGLLTGVGVALVATGAVVLTLPRRRLARRS